MGARAAIEASAKEKWGAVSKLRLAFMLKVAHAATSLTWPWLSGCLVLPQILGDCFELPSVFFH